MRTYTVMETCIWVPFRVVSCVLNAATGGSFYESFCSRVFRSWVNDHRPKPLWYGLMVGIDFLFLPFDREHCWKQFLITKRRKIDNKWSVSWLWKTF